MQRNFCLEQWHVASQMCQDTEKRVAISILKNWRGYRPDKLTFGLFSINSGACSYPATATRIARAAEATGFDSLWAGEHVVLPDPQAPPSPLAPQERILDPLVALSFLAGQTRRVLLGTGIIILPQRNPLVLAKQVASLDELAEGRLLFGVGVGYLQAELRALGIPFEDRGARSEEYLAAMRAIWREPEPEYHGQFASFANVQAHPRRNIRIVMVAVPRLPIDGRCSMQSAGMVLAWIWKGRLVLCRGCARRQSVSRVQPNWESWRSASRPVEQSTGRWPNSLLLWA